MPHIDKQKLIQLQKDSLHIRNICILAHVDHGKTTLADSLVASNGIISQRLAGKLRYLDSRSDEQERGITMKSSSISLYYKGYSLVNEFIINLIDSPGHVDFSSEVSTAVRLCDGAIILVDVVEGVCPQTRICLKQAYIENLKPILVLNKIDRLIVEKQMTPLDAYIHISQVLEQVNAVMGNLFASDIVSKEVKTDKDDYTSGLEDSDDSNLYFTPESGNVIFCSAMDGWAFIIRDFAQLYERKLGILSSMLEKVLWGDFYYSTKDKFYKNGAQQKAKKPMFVQFILENIWNLYDVIVIRKQKEKIPGIAEKLGIKISTKDLRQNDPRLQIQSIFSQWLPIERAVLEMIVRIVPRPGLMSDEKAERLMCSLSQSFNSFPEETRLLKEQFKQSNQYSDHTIVFISKMISMNKSILPQNKRKPLTNEEMEMRRMVARQRHSEKIEKSLEEQHNVDLISNINKLKVLEISKETDDIEEIVNDVNDNVFIAFARVYSGTLKIGSKIFVLSPKHDPRTLDKTNPLNSPFIIEVTIENLYLLMGRELEEISEAPAGNIVGIGGLHDIVLKTATLSNNIYCPSFCALTLMATPILRVAVEPKNTLDMPKLIVGLKQLNQADACVQVIVQETGEHVLLTLGEIHLERCVYDLETCYAKIKLNISEPIVPFRETIVPKATIDMVNEIVIADDEKEDKSIIIYTANKQYRLEIVALPLPEEIIVLLEKNIDILQILSKSVKGSLLSSRIINDLNKFKELLTEAFQQLKIDSNKQADIIDRIWSFGPKKCGTNILLNFTNFTHKNFWDLTANNTMRSDKLIINDNRYDLENSFINGFQLATAAGPLCEEPMQGVCYIIKEWHQEDTFDVIQAHSPISGQIMSAVKEGCRKAFQNQPQRLVTPMYSCTIVVNAEVLGKMYAVIGRRNGRVLSADLTYGSENFLVEAVIPVIESFNFSQEIRKQTSGLAYPQLVFSHWEIIDLDPFWVPSTDEEYLHFGDKADSSNRSKMYMDSVRKRKGLYVEEKLVEHAEKQRTLSKKK